MLLVVAFQIEWCAHMVRSQVGEGHLDKTVVCNTLLEVVAVIVVDRSTPLTRVLLLCLARRSKYNHYTPAWLHNSGIDVRLPASLNER